MDEIVKIIFERNKERKLLKSDDIKKICFIILEKKGYRFVKHVETFPSNPKDSACAAVYYDGHIFFFLNETLDIIQDYFEKFSSRYNIDGASIDIYNYFYLSIILHELAHVRQNAIIKSKHNSIEKKLFSMFLSLSNNSNFYNENYFDILTEVNANNVSMVTANYIYSKLPNNFLSKNDWQSYQLFLLKTLLYDNYQIVSKKDKIVSPSERIISAFDEKIISSSNTTIDDYIKLIYNTDNLTLYKKLMLGLPISYLEYSYSSLIGDRINSGDESNLVKKLQKKI